eukprot:130034-Chlamydomonas_euryale.AAC.1
MPVLLRQNTDGHKKRRRRRCAAICAHACTYDGREWLRAPEQCWTKLCWALEAPRLAVCCMLRACMHGCETAWHDKAWHQRDAECLAWHGMTPRSIEKTGNALLSLECHGQCPTQIVQRTGDLGRHAWTFAMPLHNMEATGNVLHDVAWHGQRMTWLLQHRAVSTSGSCVAPCHVTL